MKRSLAFLAVTAASAAVAAAVFFLIIYLLERPYAGYWIRLGRFLWSRESIGLAFLFGVLCAAGLSLAGSLRRLGAARTFRMLANPLVSGALAGGIAPVAYVLWLTVSDGGWDALQFRASRDWVQVFLFAVPFSLSVALASLLLNSDEPP